VGSNPTVGLTLWEYMQTVNPKWLKSGLVLVCERCLKERIPDEDPQTAERIGDFHLRDWLKDRLKAEGRWGPIRAINTSCMDVCARGRMTVAIEPENGAARVLVVDAIDDREELYATIVEMLG
jgi:predicted metal-binding protein